MCLQRTERLVAPRKTSHNSVTLSTDFSVLNLQLRFQAWLWPHLYGLEYPRQPSLTIQLYRTFLWPHLYGPEYPRQPSLPMQLYRAFIWEKGVPVSRVKVDLPWLFIKLFFKSFMNTKIFKSPVIFLRLSFFHSFDQYGICWVFFFLLL